MKGRARRRALLSCVGAAALAFGCVSEARAQWVGVRLGRGFALLEGQGVSDEKGEAAASRSDQYWVQRFRLPLAGYLIDPRVIFFQASLAPSFRQSRSDFELATDRSKGFAYDMSTILFRPRRVSMSFQLGQNRDVGQGDLGLRRETESRFLGASLRFRDRYFPVLLTHSDNWSSSLWSGVGVGGSIGADRRITLTRAQVNNARLRATLDRTAVDADDDLQDQVRTSAAFDHRIGWGKQSQLSTNLRFEARSGNREASVFTWNELARITHTESAVTQLSWSSRRWTGVGQELSVRSSGLSTRLRPTGWMSAQVGLSRRAVRSGDGVETASYQVSPSLGLSFRGASGWQGALNVAMGLLGESVDGLSDGAWVEVLAEEHQVDESLQFGLTNVGVDTTSVELWSGDQAIRYVEGIDYLLFAVGGRVEIRVMPGGRIDEGDVLLASYRYQAGTRVQGQSTSFSVNGSLSNRIFSLTLGRRQNSGNPITESESLPQAGSEESWIGVGVDVPPSFLGEIRLSADRRMRRFGDLETTSDEARGVWELPLRGRLKSRVLGGLVRHADQEAGTRNSDIAVEATWVVSRSLTIDGRATRNVWQRGERESERFTGLHASARWIWGLFTTTLDVSRDAREGSARLVTDRWGLSVRRVF